MPNPLLLLSILYNSPGSLLSSFYKYPARKTYRMLFLLYIGLFCRKDIFPYDSCQNPSVKYVMMNTGSREGRAVYPV